MRRPAISKRSTKFDLNVITLRFKGIEKKLPYQIGNLAVNWFKNGFRKGGGMTNRSRSGWQERSIYSREKDKGRAILVKSGNLRSDIKRRETRFNRIVIATRSIDYASYHNNGTKTMPKREFIGDRAQLNKRIKTLITQNIEKAFK